MIVEMEKLKQQSEMNKRDAQKFKQMGLALREKIKSSNIDNFKKEIKDLNEKLLKMTRANDVLSAQNDAFTAQLEKLTMDKENADETSSPKTVHTKKFANSDNSKSNSINIEEEEENKQSKNNCAQQ